MKRVALIPARGRSKRLPRKNILDFLGKPIIAYTIEAAIQSKLFERVVVSTEDNEIADISKKYGAEISIRPEKLANDVSRVLDVCIHFLNEEAKACRKYDILCCLYATAPLRTAEDISNTLALVDSGEADFAFAISEYHFPPHQALKINEKSFLEPVWPEWVEKKSQEVPGMLIDNGSTYVANIERFLQEQSFHGERLKGYLMPKTRSFDIDTIDDFYLAEKFADLK